MSDDDGWLERYGAGHENLHNPIVFWLAVPMVAVGAVGLLWSLPIPEQFFRISPLLNWGSAFLMVTAVYYFIISLPIAIGMLPFLTGVAAIQIRMLQSGLPLEGISAAFLLAGTIGFWLGHRRGLRPVIDDLLHMMIGPAYMLSCLYRRFGIPY